MKNTFRKNVVKKKVIRKNTIRKRVVKKKVIRKRVVKNTIGKSVVKKKILFKKNTFRKSVTKNISYFKKSGQKINKKNILKKKVVKNIANKRRIVVKRRIVGKRIISINKKNAKRKTTKYHQNNLVNTYLYQLFIVIRFSLAFTTKGMKPSSKTLNSKRLKQRFSVFERICLPSLIRQRLKENCMVIIKITDNLPSVWKERLYSITKNYPDFIKIHVFDSKTETYGGSLHNKYILEYIKPETQYIATSRLDDDDALAPEFTTIVSKYIRPEYKNKIISFPRGYSLDMKTKKFGAYKRRLLALGLTLVQENNDFEKFQSGAYSGNHTKWGRKTKCIFLPNIMYIRTLHGVNDSGMNTEGRRNLTNKNLSILRKKFGAKI